MNKIGKFILGIKKEMSRVRWPKKHEMIKYSVAILICIIIMGVFFVFSDVIIAALIKLLGGLS